MPSLLGHLELRSLRNLLQQTLEGLIAAISQLLELRLVLNGPLLEVARLRRGVSGPGLIGEDRNWS